MSDKRIAIFPTRMNKTIIETKLKSAEKGHSLLKKKSDALQARFRQLQKVLDEKKRVAETFINNCYDSLAHSEYLGASVSTYINACKKKPIFIDTSVEQVSGVSIPNFKVIQHDKAPVISYGKTGQSLMKCRDQFITALNLLVELCMLQNSFRGLNEVFQSTNRKINSLEFLMIPKLKNTLSYIFSELDENEREEFFRLKKVQNVKKRMENSK
ncbi:vacuolar atp synthase subunit d [Tubulinosema ratisbonensis]|uniref:Vacuolar atp synthase subunit d n=1 Tax=Tubulinosema ratisbonensis TaxID=291195 RepID=A0A437ALA1_9MICR|nr:vacuolar atp synthase subunit d [Tubulinosema ratisbonensis]